jgi:pantoate--beta-alanine ligase
MTVLDSLLNLNHWVEQAKSEHKHIGLVPTMGALHEGHLSLVRQIKPYCNLILVSIFVNPSQFGPNEDFSSYPRTLDQDIELLKKEGVSAIFCPTPSLIYPNGHEHSAQIHIPKLSSLYCGKSRPQHFDGVCSVVLRLFHLSQADYAIFGEKDFQQLQLIKRLVSDLFLPIDILSAPIYREKSGLAMSSRNRYLNEAEKQEASSIFKAIQQVQNTYKTGQTKSDHLITVFKQTLSPQIKVDYVVIVDPNTLLETSECSPHHRLLFAGYIGKCRLIDNSRLENSSYLSKQQ